VTVEWKPVVGFEGHYTVSSDGAVLSLRTQRVLKGRKDRYGYRRVGLVVAGHRARTDLCVHRIVLDAFSGPRMAGQEARHLDGDKHNNAASNLAWGTRAENQLDRVAHRILAGTRSPNARLTAAEVRAIRADTRLLREIAGDYGVAAQQISRIRRGLSYREVAPT
jgi:hypothetical protein